jgi:hypothetical protein
VNGSRRTFSVIFCSTFTGDFSWVRVTLVSLALYTLAVGCSGLPKPDFTWEPQQNPEVGDTLIFINESRRADAYSWEFGDGGVSNSSNPFYIYQKAGVFDITLNAMNDAGSNVSIQSIKIYEPTILEFHVFDSTGNRSLEDALVWVYENADDRDNLVPPPFERFTDSLGRARIRNLESRIYHVWVAREDPEGLWSFRGYTNPLLQNKVNIYSVRCTL